MLFKGQSSYKKNQKQIKVIQPVNYRTAKIAASKNQ